MPKQTDTSEATGDAAHQLKAHTESALAELAAAADDDGVEAVRIKVLGRKGWMKSIQQQMKSLPADQKKTFGLALNESKDAITDAIAAAKTRLANQQEQSDETAIDVTLPGIRPLAGHRHPILSTMDEIKSILIGLGFRYDDYPEVETEFYNFDSLNTPEWHPARDSHDSFYTPDGRVLRTHTTAFQTHAMKQFGPPPLRAMTSGRCYRRDEIDASHYPIFHQLDAIAIDRGISFADLKWTLHQLAAELFGGEVKLRFRPSYFPFTTPSAEVDVWFKGRWMEILGSGMIRPEVLAAGEIDASMWQGFAFGLGVDRMAMIRHGIDDIRLMYDNEDAFLRQF